MGGEASIIDSARAARSSAEQIVSRHKPGAQASLRAVLADCLLLCERCNRDPEERAALDDLFREDAKASSGRRYVEHGTDIYLRVCRFVFDRDSSRQASWRYANALRGAADSQVRSGDFASWCKANGGVAAISRQLFADGVTRTSVLRLDRLVVVPRGGEFALRLRKSGAQYEVLHIGAVS
jgi:hypothetical protein